MYTSTEIQHKVNDFIANLTYDRTPKSLYQPVEYVLSAGGKRLRPVLLLMAYNLYKDDIERAMWTACGLETYHNYTLLHDDLMDKADVRRGRMTVHNKWDENTAILSGDSMLVLAYERIAKCADDKLREVLSCFTETALEIGEGQQYDMDFETRRDVSEEEYIEMIRLKTSVLLACALKIGALLAGADDEDQKNLYRFGENIGLAFQLQDDYLDVYGDEKVFGKAIGGDICNNKKTYMLINALNLAQGDDKAQLDKWLSAQTFDRAEKIKAVTDIYNNVGVGHLAKNKMEHYLNVAKTYLSKVKVADERKKQLEEYAEQLMLRKS